MENIELAIQQIVNEKPIKIVLSNPKDKNGEYSKILIQQMNEQYLVEKFTEKQVFHERKDSSEISPFLEKQLSDHFRQLNAFTDTATFEVKISKKGKVFFGRSKNVEPIKKQGNGHNRQKNYILPEGILIEPLMDMGIFTKEGKIVQSMYHKYKQINRFIEQVDDVIRTSNLTEITVIDFGCGKSYLTFILYYYLTEIRGIQAKMIGLDLKAEVIEKCNQAAKKYGYDGLHFQLGDINGFKWEHPVDMVITLHACDTATDFALFNAIEWNAKMIFSVPCCQHELNDQIDSSDYGILTRYGIIKERISALMTDAIRGNLLEVCGYKTQILEFVDLAHTPKNILIRAVKSSIPEKTKREHLQEVEKLCQEFSLQPTLRKLLEQSGRIK